MPIPLTKASVLAEIYKTTYAAVSFFVPFVSFFNQNDAIQFLGSKVRAQERTLEREMSILSYISLPAF